MSSTVESHKVIIIGAGPGGICAAIKLREAGIEDIVILEKGGDVGGTWYHNRYPGAECDIKSHLYSFSFDLNPDWSRPYSGQAEILAYMKRCAAKYGLPPLCRFGAEVTGAAWDEARALWTIRCADGRSFEAPAVISGVGMFNRPVTPPIEGLSDFRGQVFHSARWDEAYDLSDRRVAVIGSAASAVQLVPEIAPKTRQLYVCQRTPNWVLPKQDEPYTAEELERFRTDPDAMKTLREQIFTEAERMRALINKAGSEKAKEIENVGLQNMMAINDPELRAKFVPNYPFGCKRPLLSNVYYPTFNRDNVELVTEPIRRFTANAIETRDGVRREIDAAIMATGFDTMLYLTVIDVVGRAGRRLADVWADGAQAYKGTLVDGFPNLFMIYGPNTNNGSIIFMIEAQVDYIVRQVARLEREKLAWLDVAPEALTAYNDRLQDAVKQVDVWTAGCSSYFIHPTSGRVVTQWPSTMGAFVDWLSEPEAEAYATSLKALQREVAVGEAEALT